MRVHEGRALISATAGDRWCEIASQNNALLPRDPGVLAGPFPSSRVS